MKISFIRLVVIVVVITSHLPAQDSGLPRERIEALEKAITMEMSRQSIPGLSVMIATENQIRWANGYGLADLENFVPAKANTVYRLGSISKPITAVAVMQLVERGKIDLDAPVQKYVRSFPVKPWPLTTRLLLAHMGGIRHYRGDEINITRYYASLLDGLDIFKDDPLLFEPGTRYSFDRGRSYSLMREH